MNILYDLYISLTEEECGKEYWTEHLVGRFKTKEEAITAMKEAMSEGRPFSKPECESRIQEVELIGEIIDGNSVYRFFGYNQEGDMIKSPYYSYYLKYYRNDYITCKAKMPPLRMAQI